MKKAYEVARRNSNRKGETFIQNKELLNLIDTVEEGFSSKVKSPLFHAIKLIENDEIEVEMHKDMLEEVNVLK